MRGGRLCLWSEDGERAYWMDRSSRKRVRRLGMGFGFGHRTTLLFCIMGRCELERDGDESWRGLGCLVSWDPPGPEERKRGHMLQAPCHTTSQGGFGYLHWFICIGKGKTRDTGRVWEGSGGNRLLEKRCFSGEQGSKQNVHSIRIQGYIHKVQSLVRAPLLRQKDL